MTTPKPILSSLLHPGVLVSSVLGGSESSSFDKFDYNANTMYFDPSSALSKKEDGVTPDTYSIVPEIITNNNQLIQRTKTIQPLVVPGGMDFEDGSARKLTFNETREIAKGHGYHFAANVRCDSHGNSTIFMVSGNGNSTASRGLFYFSSSRYIVFMAGTADGSIAILGHSTTKLAIGQWYTVEVSLIADGSTINPLKIWINGVQETLLSENASPFTIPDSSPYMSFVGNQYQSTQSFHGVISEFVLQNENIDPAGDMRLSQSQYLNARRLLL